MKLSEFSDDRELDEIVGKIASAPFKALGGLGKAMVKTTSALAGASGTSSDLDPGSSFRNPSRALDPGNQDRKTDAEVKREKAEQQKDMQATIREKEKEIQELKKQMAELQRQR